MNCGWTDWNALCEPHWVDIIATTECVTDYINFCVESIFSTRIVRCFSNNNPEKAAEHKEESLQEGRQGVIEDCSKAVEKEYNSGGVQKKVRKKAPAK